MQSVVIFGAGIAGLSAAHELNRIGYEVRLIEATDRPGGFFKSARLERNHMPTEYSWHGLGPWYHNTFDLMKSIPFDDRTTLYDAILSRPIDFGIFPNDDKAQFYDRGLRSIPDMFRMNGWEFIKWAYLMLKAWTANTRGEKKYAAFNAAQAWQPLLGETAYKTWRACFGPWIGSDWSRASLHTAGDFFRKQLTTRPVHHHRADDEGPAWSQGAGDGWLLLKGPSNEYWFDPWVKHLEQEGVAFSWNTPLTRLEFDGRRITTAVAGEKKITADVFILALNPFYTADILRRSPDLEKQAELRLFQPLVQEGPHTQVSFRMAFGEPIHFPRERTAVVVSDSEFNLTLFAQEQAWDKHIDLGASIKSLWTGTSCISSVPGRIYGKPVENCTREEFIQEVKAQVLACGALDELVRTANHGKKLSDFPMVEIEVWHEWEFSRHGIKGVQPKWVTTFQTQPFMPAQRTPVPNLFLAGAHTRTQAHVWSIEGAVESGRRAARAIDERITVIDQYKPDWIIGLSRIDDWLYRLKAPHLIDAAGLLFVLAIVLAAMGLILSRMAAG